MYIFQSTPPCWIKNKSKLYESKRSQGQQGTENLNITVLCNFNLIPVWLLDEQYLNYGTK